MVCVFGGGCGGDVLDYYVVVFFSKVLCGGIGVCISIIAFSFGFTKDLPPLKDCMPCTRLREEDRDFKPIYIASY